MTNFGFLLSIPVFETFADTAVAAERIHAVDPATCAMKDSRL